MVLTTTVRAEVCGNADILRAYQDQTTTVAHVQGVRLNHTLFVPKAYPAMILSREGYDRRGILAMAVQPMHPLGH